MYKLGIDVGGTNTDAVLIDEDLKVIGEVKYPTSGNVFEGIMGAVQKLLKQTQVDRSKIRQAMLGTTQCTNAIVERKNLAKIGLLRIGAPATVGVPPMVDWPEDIRFICEKSAIIGGGFEYDGKELAPLDEAAARDFFAQLKGVVHSIAISCVFSTVRADHERRAAEICREVMGEDVHISISSEIGSMGLIERENATILNAALYQVAERFTEGFAYSLAQEGITNAEVYLSQNDGTLMTMEHARRYPILTIACGPTNSIRGASYLSHLDNAIVIDVGGTTTDLGVIQSGFPRESGVAVTIGGVRTNFRMPDVYSIGLGGGSIVRQHEDGTVTETTKNPDGSKEVVETKKDGTVTATTTDSAGNETQVVENPDGSAETTVSNVDGSSSVTTVGEDGTIEASVKLPAKVIEDAVDSDAVVALPMPAVPVTADASAAASVTVALPAGRSARVEIPAENVTAGIVAVLVKADGTEQVVKTSTVTENGVAVTVSDGDTVKIVDNSKDFTDVSSTYWAADAIAFATSHELFAGTTTTTFTPGAPMTRVMIVTVLARYASDDSSLVIGYAEGQQWAVETGISDGSNMSGTVTRQQMAAMLYRYADYKGYDVSGRADLDEFPDGEDTSAWAEGTMGWAVAEGLISGGDNNALQPQGSAIRAQAASILMRFDQNLVKN